MVKGKKESLSMRSVQAGNQRVPCGPRDPDAAPQTFQRNLFPETRGQDRLTLSCLMDIDKKGNMISHKIAETVICVDERMNYTDVKNILEDTDEEAKKRYEKLVPMFF